MAHSALTIVTPIKQADLAALDRYLCAIGEDIRHNPSIDFSKDTLTHFCRWVIFDEDTDHPKLLFNANFDGAIDTYLHTQWSNFRPAFDAIWSCCEGYPAGYKLNPTTFERKFIDYLKDHAHKPQVFFRAYFDRSRGEIAAARKLRIALRDLIDTPQARPLAGVIRDLPVIMEKQQAKSGNILATVAGTVLAPIGSLVKLISGDKPKFDPNDPGPVVRIPLDVTEREIVQNELTIMARILPSRVLFLHGVLPLVDYFSKPPFAKDGKLSDMTTIHFARWVILPHEGGPWLHFESNYDGSWEKYIDDFIDHAYTGLDLTFGSCEGYPKGGARNSEYFKKAILDHQKRAQCFYSAHPDISVPNIINDLAIYDHLRQMMGQAAITAWLRRI